MVSADWRNVLKFDLSRSLEVATRGSASITRQKEK